MLAVFCFTKGAYYDAGEGASGDERVEERDNAGGRGQGERAEKDVVVGACDVGSVVKHGIYGGFGEVEGAGNDEGEGYQTGRAAVPDRHGARPVARRLVKLYV